MARRTSTEMKIMRINVKSWLKKANWNYKEAYKMYKEFETKEGNEEIHKLTYIKDISDFRNESEKYAETQKKEPVKKSDKVITSKSKEVKMEILTKKEFTQEFVKTLQNYFGYAYFWNGKESQEYGLNCNGLLGCSYTNREDRAIVMTFKKDKPLSMLSTLIHETAHSFLHHKTKIDTTEGEIEAETVAKKVFKIFGKSIPKHDMYINHFKQKYFSKFRKEHIFDKERIKIINCLVEQIAKVLEVKKELINSLENSTIVKKKTVYYIYCKECGSFVGKRKSLKGAKNLCETGMYRSSCCHAGLIYKEVIE